MLETIYRNNLEFLYQLIIAQSKEMVKWTVDIIIAAIFWLLNWNRVSSS